MPDLPIKAGSPAISLGLAISMAAWYLVLALSGSVSWGWEAFNLTVFRLWALLLFLNLAAGLLGELRQRTHLTRLLVCAAGLAVLASGAYLYLFRFQGIVGLAEGEAYEPIPPAFSSVEKGPLAPLPELAFTVTRVEPDKMTGRVEIVQQGKASLLGPAWRAIGDCEVRYLKTGLAPLVTVAGKEKGELERSYVKLDLDPPGKEESFAFDTLPFEFYLRKEKPKAGKEPAFGLKVHRGKMSLFDGPVTLGQKAPVQDLAVSIVEERKFAMLEIRSRRGKTPFFAALGLLAATLVAAALAKVKPSKR